MELWCRSGVKMGVCDSDAAHEHDIKKKKWK